ncbi:MAG: hypothetical protein M5U34_40880 [Chloroflexi bacterium]|nr:hypothetical protein [Chloroflexota bacterium]
MKNGCKPRKGKASAKKSAVNGMSNRKSIFIRSLRQMAQIFQV